MTVGDRQWLSFYGDRTITALLKVAPCALATARRTLTELGLIEFEPPLYQVLDLTPGPRQASTSEPRSIAELLADLAKSRPATTERRN